MINIKNLDSNKSLDSNKIKTDKKSYKNFLIYHIAYVTINDLSYAKIDSVNPFYLIITKVNEYIEESNGNKYLTLLLLKVKTLRKYKKLWDKIRYTIKSISNNSDNYDEKYMKIKFNLDDDLKR